MTDIPAFLTRESHKPRKYLGVVWHKRQGMWRCKVKKHGREFYKAYKSQETAARVRDVAAIMVHGRGNVELNFDGEPPEGITKSEIYVWLLNAGVLCKSPESR